MVNEAVNISIIAASVNISDQVRLVPILWSTFLCAGPIIDLGKFSTSAYRYIERRETYDIFSLFYDNNTWFHATSTVLELELAPARQ